MTTNQRQRQASIAFPLGPRPNADSGAILIEPNTPPALKLSSIELTPEQTHFVVRGAWRGREHRGAPVA